MADTLFIDASMYPTIQDAINAAIAATPGPVAVVLPDGPTFLTSEVQIPVLPQSRPLTLLGRRHRGIDQNKGTTLIATAPMRSMIAVLSANHRIQDIRMDANRQARYGLYMQNSYASQFDNVLIMNALLDGWHFTSDNSNNDAVHMVNCWAHANGTTFATAAIASQYQGLFAPVQTIGGTASISAGNTTINVTGGPDLTTLGIRRNDFVRVGDPANTAFFGTVDSVSVSSIVVQPQVVPQMSGAGLPFAAFVGFGVNLANAVDNNVLVVSGGQFRGNSGSNFNVQGLFGSTFIGCVFTFGHFAGFSVSRTHDDAVGQGTLLQNCYFEANQAAEIWADRYTDVTVLAPVFQSVRPPYKIRPHELTSSPARGMVVSNGIRTLLPAGTEQTFVFELRNNGGTLEHRIVSDSVNGSPTSGASQINGASPTFTATPTLGAGTGFAAGAGIVQNSIVFDTVAQAPAPDFRPPSAVVEADGTARRPGVSVTQLSSNVGGTTVSRFALAFSDNGNPFPLTTAGIQPGQRLAVRVAGGSIR
jgi:hypothetical protein